MSSIVHKVKDALKPDNDAKYSHGTTGQEGHDVSHMGTGKHGQTSGTMPGAFGSGVGGTDTSHGASKYASEPTQGSYSQHQPSDTNHGAGYGTTAAGAGATGAGAAALSSQGGHVSRNEIPNSHLMDPSNRSHGSNIMDRSRDYYATEGATTDPAKLYKRDDPRGNYDNSGHSARADQEAALRRDQTADAARQTGHGDATSGSGYKQTDKSSREPHGSKILNKLDPRVDSSALPERDSSRYQERDSGLAGGTATGATTAATTAAATHGSHHQTRTERADYGHQPTTTQEPYTSSRSAGDTYGTTTDHTLATRTHDPHGTPTTARGDSQRGALARDSTAAPVTHTTTNPTLLAHQQATSHHHAEAVPYSMSGAHTQGHDGGAGLVSSIRSHFHCMSCGHKNDASHLKDAQGGVVKGRKELHCMNCGHRNEVGHMLG